MSYRRKGPGWVVEVYDPQTKAKRHVKAAEHGMAPPRTEREAKRLERLALTARDAQRLAGTPVETVAHFAARWTEDFPRAEATNLHNAERVKAFTAQHGERPLASVDRETARQWSKAHAGQIPALRAMFTDAASEGICTANPFVKLGLSAKTERKHSPLTETELHELADLAPRTMGLFGVEFSALIRVAAYTCLRPGELFAMRWSLIDGDEYDVRTQLHSRLGKETGPKHGSVGRVLLPPGALEALDSMPRRLDDDIIFRTAKGARFSQPSLHYYWHPLRMAAGRSALRFYDLRHFGATHMLNTLGLEPWVIAKQLRHSDGGALVLSTYGHPDEKVARERIRQAFAAADSGDRLGNQPSENRRFAAQGR